MSLTFIYVKYTVPGLPEAVRTSIGRVVMTGPTPEATLLAIRRKARGRKLNATYELVSKEEYDAHRQQSIR